MTPRIVRIEDAGPDRKARRLVFDDDTDPRITAAAVVKALGLEVDAEMPRDALESALAEAESSLARERALRLLGYRERSVAELTRKLRDSGYGPDTIAPILSRFVELGLVDDERFAGMWVRSRAASGHGGRRIARELAEKGVPPEIAAAALQRDCPPDAQLARARESLRGRRAHDRKERERLVRKLVSRGFDLSTALQAVADVATDSDGDAES